MFRKSFVYLLFAGLCAVLPLGARAQTVNGVIAGTVTDPSGAVVPNVRVTATNTGTGISQTTTTGAQGEYRFPLVPPGTYVVQFEANGFATQKATGVVVQASQTVPFSVKLSVASMLLVPMSLTRLSGLELPAIPRTIPLPPWTRLLPAVK